MARFRKHYGVLKAHFWYWAMVTPVRKRIDRYCWPASDLLVYNGSFNSACHNDIGFRLGFRKDVSGDIVIQYIRSDWSSGIVYFDGRDWTKESRGVGHCLQASKIIDSNTELAVLSSCTYNSTLIMVIDIHEEYTVICQQSLAIKRLDANWHCNGTCLCRCSVILPKMGK